MRILVVDDEKLLVKGVKFNLENEGAPMTVPPPWSWPATAASISSFWM